MKGGSETRRAVRQGQGSEDCPGRHHGPDRVRHGGRGADTSASAFSHPEKKNPGIRSLEYRDCPGVPTGIRTPVLTVKG